MFSYHLFGFAVTCNLMCIIFAQQLGYFIYGHVTSTVNGVYPISWLQWTIFLLTCPVLNFVFIALAFTDEKETKNENK